MSLTVNANLTPIPESEGGGIAVSGGVSGVRHPLLGAVLFGVALLVEVTDQLLFAEEPAPTPTGCPDSSTLATATRDPNGVCEPYDAWAARVGVDGNACDYRATAGCRPNPVGGELFGAYGDALTAAGWTPPTDHPADATYDSATGTWTDPVV